MRAVSCWRGRRDVNGASIGIELVNPGHEFGYRAFPEAQIAALEALCPRHPRPPPNSAAPRARPFRRGARAQAGSGRAVPVAAARARRDRALARAAAARRAARHRPASSPPSAMTRPSRRRRRSPRSSAISGRPGATGSPTKKRAPSPPPWRDSAARFDSALASRPYLAAPDGRMAALAATAGEESPGSTEARCRVTPGGGDPRESATETYRRARPKGRAARVKWCGKSAPRRRQRRRQGKPHREQDQVGAAGAARRRAGFRAAARVGRARRPVTGVPDEWSSPAFGRGQNPAYRPSGIDLNIMRTKPQC